MKTEIFLHVGMHKTATTFLQEEVFEKIKEQTPLVEYTDKWSISTPIREGYKNIISDENLDGGSYRLPSDADKQVTIIKNLSKLYPNANIIICIRNKKGWLRSAYNQYVLGYGAKDYTFEEYCSSLDSRITDFDSYISLIKKHFKSVYVCRFEDFVLNPQLFIEDLCSFIGIDVPENINYEKKNQSLKPHQIKVLRTLSKVAIKKEFYFPISVLVKIVRGDVKFGKWGRKV